MNLRLWPRSLIGQLVFAVALMLFVAQAVNFALLVRGQKQQTLAHGGGMAVARIRTVLRRTQQGGRALDPGGTSYAFADWVLREVERVLVDSQGNEVALSSGEYHLLHALVRHPRQVMSRDRLLDLVRGREAEIFDRAIDNLVSRLRKKIEVDAAHPQIVKTVWGGGYTLACEVKRMGPAA